MMVVFLFFILCFSTFSFTQRFALSMLPFDEVAHQSWSEPRESAHINVARYPPHLLDRFRPFGSTYPRGIEWPHNQVLCSRNISRKSPDIWVERIHGQNVFKDPPKAAQRDARSHYTCEPALSKLYTPWVMRISVMHAIWTRKHLLFKMN